jgi:hypothetical protein
MVYAISSGSVRPETWKQQKWNRKRGNGMAVYNHRLSYRTILSGGGADFSRTFIYQTTQFIGNWSTVVPHFR